MVQSICDQHFNPISLYLCQNLIPIVFNLIIKVVLAVIILLSIVEKVVEVASQKVADFKRCQRL
jgi:hypothetical protein